MNDNHSDDSLTSRVTKRLQKKVRISTEPQMSDYKLSLKVPAFCREDPEIWFALLAGQFKNLGIVDDDEKYHCVVSNIDASPGENRKRCHQPAIEQQVCEDQIGVNKTAYRVS